MDAAPPPPAPGPELVRLSEPDEIAEALPHLLGFRPHESVVLVGLGGPSGTRVLVSVRGDLPPAGRAGRPPWQPATDLAGELATELVTALVGGAVEQIGAALVAVVSEAADVSDGPGGPDLPHRDVLHEVVMALAVRGIPARESLLVRGGRWWSFDCSHPCCLPGAGTPLSTGVSAIAAASVGAGQVVAASREELASRIARSPDPRGILAAAVLRIGRSYAEQVLAEGRDAVAVRSWAAITEAAARQRPEVLARLPDVDLARVVWGLRDVAVRDRALALALSDDAAAAERLWTECTRRAPAPLDAAPATLLAVSAWLRGDGTTAGLALARALTSDPGYRLAQLLADALAACLPPEQLRTLVSEATGR